MNFLKRDFSRNLKNVHDWRFIIFYIGDYYMQPFLFLSDTIT